MDDFKCLGCGKALAQTDGRRLMVNGTQFKGACGSGQVRFICQCGTSRTWHPVSKPIAKRDRIVV